jgi:hypothetical protein
MAKTKVAANTEGRLCRASLEELAQVLEGLNEILGP